ncbi:MAG: SAM-dependent methyltransferase [Candidatus Altiarchaeota archaeon]
MIRLVYDVGRYRSVLADSVREGDVVVEIGPHVGKSTADYVEKAGKVVLVDKGSDCAGALDDFAGEHGNVVFVCGDVRGFDAMKLVLNHVDSCDVLAVDMGGGRHADTVFKVWATWSGVFKPRDSVIRNRELAEFIQRVDLDDDSVVCRFDDAGWLAKWGRKTPFKLKKQLEEFKYWIDINEPLD